MADNIFFYCPSKKIGGEQQLYIRCAHYIEKNSNALVHYIDYPDGYANDILSSSIIRINSKNIHEFVFPPNSLLIIALSFADKFFELFSSNNVDASNFRVLFWSLQPYNLTGKILIRNKYNLLTTSQKRAFCKCISLLCKDGIIRFMDYNNYHTVHTVFGVQIDNINYLPVPINDMNIKRIEDCDFRRVNNDKISFLWLSRIDHDKKHTLMTIINEIDDINKGNPSKLYIIGDGNALEEVKDFASSKTIEVEFLGRVFGEELDNFIDDNIDVGVGMGTSGLEIAKRAKPVIMKKVMPKTRPSGYVDDYIFLHQEYGYSLGSPDFYVEGQSIFKTKVNELLDNYSLLAEKDYRYTKNNHSIATTGDMLLKISNQNGMSEEDITAIKTLGELIKKHRRYTLR